MPVARYDAPSTGIEWLDALTRAFHSDPMGGISPVPMAGGAASMVSPGARRLLKMIGWASAETQPPATIARRALPRPMKHPAAQLRSPIARAQGVAGDINAPQVIADLSQNATAREHYLRLLNRVLERANPVKQDPIQAGAYELLLSEYLRGGLP